MIKPTSKLLLFIKDNFLIYNFPRWSPDEQYIIFTGILTNGTETSIYKIEVNGNNLTKLADNASNPDWIK